MASSSLHMSVVLLLMLCQIETTQSQKWVPVNKCCPVNQVLNDWNICASGPENFAINSLCTKMYPVPTSFCSPAAFKVKGDMFCPKRHLLEFKVGSILQNGSILAKLSNHHQQSSFVLLENSHILGCVDMAIVENGAIEGPIYLTCMANNNNNNNNNNNKSHLITKCCKQGQVLDHMTKKCTKEKGSGGGNPLMFLPSRLVKEPSLGTSYAQYHIQHYNWSNSGCGEEKLTHFEVPLRLYTNGSALFRHITPGQSVAYNCVDRSTAPHGALLAQMCVKRRTQVSKCCPANEHFDLAQFRCITSSLPNNSSAQLNMFKLVGGKLQMSAGNYSSSDDFYLQKMAQKCPTNENLPRSNFLGLLTNGQLYRDNQTHMFLYDPGNFCLDTFLDPKSLGPFQGAFVCPKGPAAALERKRPKCFEGQFEANLRIVYTVLGIASLLTLTLTLYLYLTLASLKNLHGHIVLHNASAAWLATLLLVLSYNIGGESCHAILGYSIYFSGLSMFTWMFVLGLDLCLTFTGLGKRLFNIWTYGLFSWGLPLCAAFVAFLVEQFEMGQIRPQIGLQTCFLAPKAAKFFFYIPICTLLSLNVIMYCITVHSLCKAKKATTKAGLVRLKSNSSKWKQTSHRERSKRSTGKPQDNHEENWQQLVLFTKLFLIMGLSWISQCVHFMLHEDHSGLQSCNFHEELFFRILGGFNMLRGMFMFVIFICKSSICQMAGQKHPKLLTAVTKLSSSTKLRRGAKPSWTDPSGLVLRQLPQSDPGAGDDNNRRRDTVRTTFLDW